MYIERYSSAHADAYAAILNTRELAESAISELPGIVICVLERGELIATAALRTVEGNLMILEGLMSNPDAPGDMRATALDMAITHLTELADQSGVKGIIAWTSDENTRVRSYKHGFVRAPKTLLTRVAAN